MQHSYYHRTLRSAAAVVALMVVFDAGLLSPVTAKLSDTTVAYLANTVGIVATVPSNPDNSIASQLARKESELDQREREIDARATDSALTGSSDTVLIAILSILLALIVLNYILDFMRSRQRTAVV